VQDKKEKKKKKAKREWFSYTTSVAQKDQRDGKSFLPSKTRKRPRGGKTREAGRGPERNMEKSRKNIATIPNIILAGRKDRNKREGKKLPVWPRNLKSAKRSNLSKREKNKLTKNPRNSQH